MGFWNSYKHLDNLCRDINGKGVSGYIEDMESISDGEYYVRSWREDYSALKHCRHIRNKIAHVEYADENNTATEKDTEWVENFHERIIAQTDPLMLYHIARQNSKKTKVRSVQNNAPRGTDTPSPQNQRTDYLPLFLLIILIGVLIVIYSFLRSI